MVNIINNNNQEFIILNIGSNVSTIKFIKTGYITNAYNANIQRGEVKDKLAPVIFNFGYIGDGPVNPSLYNVWRNMLQRVLSSKRTSKNFRYATTTVNSEWASFQNFQQWCIEHNYNPKIHSIDKDILGFNEYGPKTCIVIPNILNSAVMYKKISQKYRDLPPGISLNKNKLHLRINTVYGLFRTNLNCDVNLAYNIYRAIKKYYVNKLASDLYMNGQLTLEVKNIVKNNYNVEDSRFIINTNLMVYTEFVMVYENFKKWINDINTVKFNDYRKL